MMNNRLKKAAALAVSVVLCILSVFVCSGEDNSYTIKEINGMQLTLPSDVTTVTRSSKADDKYFSLFGLDYDTTMTNLKNGNIYLQGMDSGSTYTVTVTMTQTEESKAIANYRLLDNDKLNEVTSNFLSQSEYSNCVVSHTDNIVWLYLTVTVDNNGQKIKTYQANTVYDGKNVNIIIQRNGGDVTDEDGSNLQTIAATVVFNEGDSSAYALLFVIIGVTVLAILIIVFLIIIVKHFKKNKKKRKNTQILEELADEYNVKRKSSAYDDSQNDYVDISAKQTEESDEGDFLEGVTFGGASTQRQEAEKIKFSEAEIDEILGYKSAQAQAVGGASEKITEPVEEKPEVIEAELTDEGRQENYDETEADEATQAYEPENDEGSALEADDDFDEYVSDDELVRQEAKQAKFNSGYDFFEEAPKKTVGVFSSREIMDAEDYDVINEVEKRATEVEKPTPASGKSASDTLKGIGSAVSSFFVHCGYFFTNLSRMIKRKNAAKKRKKAEEERRRRAKMRAERQRRQRLEMENGGLVQVHKRSNGSTKPSSASRQSSRSTHHPSSRTNTRPSNRPTNRR